VQPREPPLQVRHTRQLEQPTDRRERELDLALAWVAPDRRALGDQEARAVGLAMRRVFDVHVRATAQRSRFIGAAAAIITEHGAGVSESAPSQLRFPVTRITRVELAPATGVGQQHGLKRPRMLDRPLQTRRPIAAAVKRPGHAQRLDRQDWRQVGTAGRAARATGRIDRGFVKQVGEILIERDVGIVDARPRGATQSCRLAGRQRCLDLRRDLAQRLEHCRESLAGSVAVPGTVKLLRALGWRTPVLLDDPESDHATVSQAMAGVPSAGSAAGIGPATLAHVPRLARLTAPVTLLSLLGLLAWMPACEKGKTNGGGGTATPGETGAAEFGYEDASSPDMAKIPYALDPNDLAGVEARGIEIWWEQRAMRLGDRGFAGFVGVTSAVFVSIATIDPGGKSGQVAYYTWDEEALADGDASPEEARNWVVVSLTLDPDEALEPQAMDGKPDGEARRTIAALQVVQEAARKEYPGARFVGYTFREQVMANGEPTGLRQTRIYMIGADDKSPDIEYIVHDPSKKKQPPEIVSTQLQLAAGATSSLPLTTPAKTPGPSTIARAVAIATVTEKPVEIDDAAGGKWLIAPKTGAMTKR
jgi:hypothetical protein